jgi:hypothetical protein
MYSFVTTVAVRETIQFQLLQTISMTNLNDVVWIVVFRIIRACSVVGVVTDVSKGRALCK